MEGHDLVRSFSLLARFSPFSPLLFFPEFLMPARMHAFMHSRIAAPTSLCQRLPRAAGDSRCPPGLWGRAYLPFPGSPSSPPPALSQEYAPFAPPAVGNWLRCRHFIASMQLSRKD